MPHRFVSHTQQGEIRIVSLALPELLESDEFGALNDALIELIAQNPSGAWILDLSHADYMGSSMLGLMVNVRQSIKQARGTLILCGMSPRLMEVFRACSLHQLFTITGTRAEAIKRASR
jgi:anti-anti-sigma factor